MQEVNGRKSMNIWNEGWSKWLNFSFECDNTYGNVSIILNHNESHLFTLRVIRSHLKPLSLDEAWSKWGSLVLKATNCTLHMCYISIIAFISVVCQMNDFFFFPLFIIGVKPISLPFAISEKNYDMQFWTIHNLNTFPCFFFRFIVLSAETLKRFQWFGILLATHSDS